MKVVSNIMQLYTKSGIEISKPLWTDDKKITKYEHGILKFFFPDILCFMGS